MNILSIEASTSIFSLCLSDDKNLLYEVKVNRLADSNRDGNLFIEAQRILEHLIHNGVDAIAVDIGPGQFTSLRVGLSLAKGLALSRSIPLVGITSLDTIAAPLNFLDAPILVVVNAYRGEFYTARYHQGQRKGKYLLLDQLGLFQELKKRPAWVLTNIEFDRKIIQIKGIKLLNKELAMPQASRLAQLAWPRIREKKFDDPESIEPFYMKRTDAERALDKKDAIK